jgi:flap endonuclease-1
VKGIGPKKALNLVRRHGAIEQMPPAIREAFEPDLDRLRRIYLEPDVSDDYSVGSGPCDIDGVVRFLCDEHAFSRDRVTAALERAFGSPKLF